MKRFFQTLLVAVAIVCALVLSASSTIALAAHAGVPGFAHPFAVGLLEVATGAGTWIWLTEPRLRWEAAAVVALASTVTGIGGVMAYGPFGLVAPLGLILTVHLLARAWTAPATTGQSLVVDEGADTIRTLHPNGVRSSSDPAPVTTELPELPAVPDLNQAEPGAGLDRSQGGAGDELDRVRAIVAQGGGRGTVAEQLGVTPRQARTLIDKVKQEVAA